MGAMEMGSPAAFAVPTGAFGNCFAGYMAKQIGVPISVIVAATNANDIVHRTISRCAAAPALRWARKTRGAQRRKTRGAQRRKKRGAQRRKTRGAQQLSGARRREMCGK
ncbi:hypothetical protein CYMTET_15242 [Cymbomonas tetramitiformis]|uniref:Threonine synthase n=1 Tax=Cymbomonas tetramitiformis TaxID=36881 RepID=A0AAE0GFW8_9CHLO|nr:hypothetical protein CYMTET_15242 [Cymbomonas tetramitiformis]